MAMLKGTASKETAQIVYIGTELKNTPKITTFSSKLINGLVC